MKLWQIRFAGDILLLSAIPALAVVANVSGIAQILFSVLALFASAGGFIIFLIFWKCPYCHKKLPFHRSFGMIYCPFCGKELE